MIQCSSHHTLFTDLVATDGVRAKEPGSRFSVLDLSSGSEANIKDLQTTMSKEDGKSKKRRRSSTKRNKTAEPADPAKSKKVKRRKLDPKSDGRLVPFSSSDAPAQPVKLKKRKRVSTNEVPVTKQIQVHRSSFLRWEIAGITAVATSPDGTLMVVARKSGCIELRQKCVGWITTFVLRWDALDETAALSSMVFDTTGKYLLVGRFNGTLDIYSVSAEGISSHVVLDPGGGAIMSLAMRPASIFEAAIGCEDGHVRFLTIDEQFKEMSVLEHGKKALPKDPSMYYVHRGHRANGMCLSLCWKAFGDDADGLIVCGDSNGGLRWMSGSTRKLVGRGTLPMLGERECHIWTVQIVAKGRQVVCGDSRGFVSIWSSTSFTKTEENRLEGMAGDIWTSAATVPEEDGTERVLFGCAGGSVGALKSLVSYNGSVSWTPIRGRSVHLNDIRGIATLGEKGFVTASTDTRLCIFNENVCNRFSEEGMLLHYHGAAGQHPNRFVRGHGLILSRQKDGIDFWQLPNTRGQDPTLALRLKLAAYEGNIRACAISSDVSRIAVSVFDKFCYYAVSKRTSKDGTKVAVLGNIAPIPLTREVSKQLEGSEHLLFLGSILVAVAEDRQSLLVMHGENEVLAASKSQLGSNAGFLTHIAVSESSKSIAVADSLGDIFVCGLEDVLENQKAPEKCFRQCASLGTDKAVACMEFSETGRKLAASLLDGSLVIVSFADETCVVGVMRAFPSLATCLSFAPDETSVLVSGHNFCYITAWAKKASKANTEKMRKLKKITHAVSLEKSLIASSLMGPSSIFLAQRPWKEEQAFLPRVLPKKLYGM